MPTLLLQELLTRGLNDRSKSLRTRAAMRCDIQRLNGMLPELEQRATVETDAEVKRELLFHAAMIRDGYLVERKTRVGATVLIVPAGIVGAVLGAILGVVTARQMRVHAGRAGERHESRGLR